jgi:peptidyl-prolyl cis-trans isomerase A (cyclophilin A)
MMTLSRRRLLAAVSVLGAAPGLHAAEAAGLQGQGGATPLSAPGAGEKFGDSPAAASALGAVRVRVETDQGPFELELFSQAAPKTSANFLRYVKSRRFDHSSFYRALRTPGAPDKGLVQGGLQNDPARLLPPVVHESTTETGLKHLDGTLSMARGAPGTATADFFICVGDSPFLDANPGAPGDALGFAAFGRVAVGMEVIKTILALPTDGPARNPLMKGQILSPPVVIRTMRVQA